MVLEQMVLELLRAEISVNKVFQKAPDSVESGAFLFFKHSHDRQPV